MQPLLFPLEGIPQVKYEKNAVDNACFLTFFTTWNLIWPKFFPKMTLTLISFASFQ